MVIINKNIISKIKKAYSLPEMLFVLGIIGVICTLMITMIHPQTNLIGMQYRNAFYGLEAGAYTAFINMQDYIVERRKSQPTYTETFLGEACLGNGTPNPLVTLCKRLEEVMNGSGACGGNEASPPVFTGVNGVTFRFRSFHDVAKNAKVSKRYVIVEVDVNGKRKPNTNKWTAKNPPDRVFFLVSDEGEVVPIGYPRFDSRYIRARVIYGDKIKDQPKRSGVTTLANAQSGAYGGREYYRDVFSMTGADFVPDEKSGINVDGLDDDGKFSYMSGDPVNSARCRTTGANSWNYPVCSVQIWY